MKEVNTQSSWSFKLGTQAKIIVPIWIVVGFQQIDRQVSQNLNKVSFYGPPVTSAQCIIGTKNYPDSASLLNYDDDGYSQRYSQMKEGFKVLTKDGIIMP